MLPDYLPAGYSQRLEGSSNYCFKLDVSLFIEQQRILLLSLRQLLMSLQFLSHVYHSTLIDWLIFEGEQI